MKRLFIISVILIVSCTKTEREYYKKSFVVFKNDSGIDLNMRFYTNDYIIASSHTNINISRSNNEHLLYEFKMLKIFKGGYYKFQHKHDSNYTNFNANKNVDILFENGKMLRYLNNKSYSKSPTSYSNYIKTTKEIEGYNSFTDDFDLKEVTYTYTITKNDYSKAIDYTKNTYRFHNRTEYPVTIKLINLSRDETLFFEINAKKNNRIIFYSEGTDKIPPPYYKYKDSAIITFYNKFYNKHEASKALIYSHSDIPKEKSPLNKEHYTINKNGEYIFEITEEHYKKAKKI